MGSSFLCVGAWAVSFEEAMLDLRGATSKLFSPTMSRFYASVVGPAPRSLTCGGCIFPEEIRLGIYRGATQCKRCGKRPAVFVVQGMAKKKDQVGN